jgi:hypothetical protein
MPDADKILEAEQSIQNIAAELKRMHDAANLLQGAQETTDTVLRAAEKVIKDTGKFSVSCGEIIRKLSATDLNQRLDSFIGRIDHISGIVDEHAKKTSVAIANTESRIFTLETSLQGVAEHAKKQRTISIVLIVLTLVTSLSVLAITLLRGIGG